MKEENKIMIYLRVGNKAQAEEYDVEKDRCEKIKNRAVEIGNEIFNEIRSDIKPCLIRTKNN